MIWGYHYFWKNPNGTVWHGYWIRKLQVCLAWIVAQEAFGALVEDVWAQSPGISIGKYATTVVMVAAGIPHKGQDLQFQRQRTYSNKNAQGHDTLDIPKWKQGTVERERFSANCFNLLPHHVLCCRLWPLKHEVRANGIWCLKAFLLTVGETHLHCSGPIYGPLSSGDTGRRTRGTLLVTEDGPPERKGCCGGCYLPDQCRTKRCCEVPIFGCKSRGNCMGLWGPL